MSEKERKLPGITIRSLIVTFFGMVLMALIVAFGEVAEGNFFTGHTTVSIHAVSITATLVFLMVFVLNLILHKFFQFRFLQKSELLCIFFALLIASPIMSWGFWHRFVGSMATIPQSADFEKMDALRSQLWPHGENLLGDALDDQAGLEVSGNVEFQEVDYNVDESGPGVLITNDDSAAVSRVRIRLPLVNDDGERLLVLEQAYLASVLVKADKLGASSNYFARIYFDDSNNFAEEFISSRAMAQRTYLHQEGFRRMGAYGLGLPSRIDRHIVIEFGLNGEGKVTFASPEFYSVLAMNNAYDGRVFVTREQYAELSEKSREHFVVKPDNLFSLAGIQYVLAAYIPLNEWVNTAIAWFSYILMVTIGSFAIVAIMRKQWMQSERYPMPTGQIPRLMLGGEDDDGNIVPAIWRNRIMWIGFGITLFWCLMRLWARYNPSVPNMEVHVSLKPYFNDPGWGKMWQINFTLVATFIALALFMEINVLFSLIVGFFIFRAFYWIGESNGWTAVPEYPHVSEMMISSYFTYALIIVIFTRKYLISVIKTIFTGKGIDDKDEPFRYRTAFGMLILAFVGIVLWSRWMDLPTVPMLAWYGIMLTFGFVAAKIRTECGTPFVWITPVAASSIVMAVGGMGFFQPSGVVFIVCTSMLLVMGSFFMIPGLQLEMLQIGRHAKVNSRHLLIACFLGISCGFFIGGWSYLGTIYALGEDGVGNKLPFTERRGEFRPYIKEMARANAKMKSDEKGEKAPRSSNPAKWIYVYGAVATTIVAVLRQLFAGFWFHPVGILLGPSQMMTSVWGSVLFALVLRLLVLKLGGAVSVRDRLLPFAVGMFLASVTAYIFLGLYNGYLYFFQQGAMRYPIIF
ncbi:MAG: DUF6785 family protein [Candidatus Sumerlaeia bacterium]